MKDMNAMLRAVRLPLGWVKRQASIARDAVANLFEDGDGGFLYVEDPRQLILQSDRPLTAEAYDRIRKSLHDYRRDQGPIVFDGGLRVIGAVRYVEAAPIDGPTLLPPVIASE